MVDTFTGGSKWQGIQILRNGAEIYRQTGGTGWADPIKEVTVGGIRYRRGAARDSQTVSQKYNWAKSDVQVYEPIVGDATVLSSATGQSVTAAVHIQFPTAGVYEIQVVRKSDTSTSNTIYNESFLTLIKSFKTGDVIKLDKPHTMLEMSVVASDKISGVVQNLSAICMSKLRWHNGTTWMPPEETRNPVWIVLDILTGLQQSAMSRSRQPSTASRQRKLAIHATWSSTSAPRCRKPSRRSCRVAVRR
jgi:hypothetical protein